MSKISYGKVISEIAVQWFKGRNQVTESIASVSPDQSVSLLMGIDVGTSATKVSVFDLEGNEIASATRETPLIMPKRNHVEQDPQSWWSATKEACKEVTSKVNSAQIRGIGVAGQSWATVLLDRKGEVLANSPLWMDTRAVDICAETVEKIGAERIFSISGNPFSPTYSTPKLLWFMREHPEIMERTVKVLQSNSFIVYRLTREFSQDLSMTYGLQFANIKDGTYDASLAEELGIDLSLFPEAVPCDQVVGRVSEEAALQTGLLPGTPVVAGGLDAACGALGTGVYRPYQCQEQGGQAGGISVATDELVVEPTLICSHHVVPGMWLLQGGTAAGGAALRWAAAQIGVPGASFAQIDSEAKDQEPVPGGLIFLPYLAGERSPIWDPDAKGVFFGLTLGTTRPQMLRSVMEGVAFSLQDNIQTMVQAGVTLGEVYSIGGASQSTLWTQIKCDVTGLDISVPLTKSATPLGAAILAGVGTGTYGSYEEAIQLTQVIGRTQKPIPEHQEVYQQAFLIYQELYKALAPLMQKSSSLTGFTGLADK